MSDTSPHDRKLVRIRAGDLAVDAEWNDSPTAQEIYNALPLSANGNYWGGEIYFQIPVSAPAEPDADDVVEPGTVAFWPAGSCLCIFWGPTPASMGEECRAASAVNVVGRVLNPEVLTRLRASDVTVEAVEG